jgi:hypothetical protein
MYKKGGKKKKESWMEESKEVHFGNKPSKMKSGGLYSPAEKAENIAKVKKMNSMQNPEHQTKVNKKTGGPDDPAPAQTTATQDSGTSDFYKLANKAASSSPRGARMAVRNARKLEVAKATGTRAGGKLGESLTGAGAALSGAAQVISAAKGPGKSDEQRTGGKRKTGGKSMEPGGGGRFAAMVSKLKGQGKSEDSAKAIAASIGRNKYGKSRFQEMAAKGKKGMGGMSDSTSANDAGMEMMESTESMSALDAMKKKKKKGTSGSHHTGPNASRAKKAGARAAAGKSKCARGEVCFD